MNAVEQRQSNIELLRIVAMLMIIAFHFSDHATIKITSLMPLNIDWIVMSFARVGGAIGNCIFVLISGYFMWQMKFRVRNVIKLWLEVFFYSVVSFVVADYLGFVETHRFLEMGKSLLPISTNQYWYASSYFVLLLLSPFLNRVIDTFSRRELLYTASVGLGIFSLWHTALCARWLGGCNNIVIFVVLYLVGAYISKYGEKGFRHNWCNFFLFIFVIFMEWVSILCLKFFLPVVGKHTGAIFYFVWGMDKMLPILAALSLFIFFSRLDIGCKRAVNVVASTVFGCYLLHIGRLWRLFFYNLFDVQKTYGTNMVIVEMAMAVVSIFLIACIVDILRQIILERNVMKLVDSIIARYGV